MLDNTSNNDTSCKTIDTLHTKRSYDKWNASEAQLPWVNSFPCFFLFFFLFFFKFMPVTTGPCRCFAHVMNLANVAVMSNITKIAAIENAAAIWEYDPALEGNHVLGVSLDVIACVRTVAIKVICNRFYILLLFLMILLQIQGSGQRIEHFEKLQIHTRLLIHSKSLSIATFNGVQLILCLIAHISHARYVVSHFYGYWILNDVYTAHHSLPPNSWCDLWHYYYNLTEWPDCKENPMVSIHFYRQRLGAGEECEGYLKSLSFHLY